MGVSLIEVLVVAALIGILAFGSSIAIVNGVEYEKRLPDAGRADLEVTRIETTLRDFVESAFVSLENPDTTYFIGSEGLVNQGTGNSVADTLTFTRVGGRLPAEVFDFDDFERANSDLGPVGGCEEVTLSLTATGSSNGQSGLFLRRQTPADGDPSQGGREQLLSALVGSITFEFFDGTVWQPLWDTREQTTRRLPGAVRVTYRLQTDDVDRVLVVRPRASDVTVDNPVEEEATA